MKMNKCEIRNVVRKQNKKGQIVPVVNEDGEDKKGGLRCLVFKQRAVHLDVTKLGTFVTFNL